MIRGLRNIGSYAKILFFKCLLTGHRHHSGLRFSSHIFKSNHNILIGV